MPHPKNKPGPAADKKPTTVKELPKEMAPETAIVQEIKMPMALRIKLGSLVVHVEELISPKGHEFDKHAINTLLQDPDVRAFMEETSKMGVLPVKR